MISKYIVFCVAVSACLSTAKANGPPPGPYANSTGYAGPQPQYTCKVPAYVPTPYVNPAKMTGVWYAYRSDGSNEPTVNRILEYTPGAVHQDPGATTKNIWMMSEVRYCQSTPQYTHRCESDFCAGRFSETGKFVADCYDSGYAEGTRTSTVFNLLYTDYEVAVFYWCAGRDVDCYDGPAGTCKKPFYAIDTRVKPSLLSDAAKARIDYLADTVLNPLCTSARNIQQHIFTDQVATCPPKNPPACARARLDGIRHDYQ